MDLLLVLKMPTTVVPCTLCKSIEVYYLAFSNSLCSFSIVMFLSTLINTTSLVAPAVTLLLTFICYGKLNNLISNIQINKL